jgi:hypothetical protein
MGRRKFVLTRELKIARFRSSKREAKMREWVDYAAVSTETLHRWLTHIEQMMGGHKTLEEIKAQIEAELLRRGVGK